MDCIIPGHPVRPFCAAISCLSRVGKDLYIDFDSIDGLTLRALNDSKSVFCSFHYEPSYFQRCALPSLSTSTTTNNRKRRKRSQQTPEDDDDRLCVRVAIKALASVIRPRKNDVVLSLQMVTVGDLLSFEFQLQRPNGVIVRVIHRVGVATAQSVAAVASIEGASELVVPPSVVMTMLEPLRRSTEIALVINETHKLVSSVTFCHEDISQEVGAVSSLAKPASLKTETSIGYDELVELDYVSHPLEVENDLNPPPEDLKEQVVLVFTLKEFKAMLQFCSQAYIDQELQVSISFFWGGKPMVVKADGAEGCSAQLVMATLDHKLLGAMKTSTGGQQE
jgi:hypothetical protein